MRHYASIIKRQRRGDLPSYLNIGIISGLKVPIDGCLPDAVMLLDDILWYEGYIAPCI